jgi:lipopolysaccharide transport protein LptA
MVIFGLMGFFAGLPATIPGAEPPPQTVFLKANQEIYIKADEVIANLDSGETRFLGNVKISQGQTVVTAERMNVYYRKPESDLKKLNLKASIYKIVARGNVRINYENIVALTDEAVYMADSKSLTLSGTGSKVISGANSITGPKFVMSLENGSLIIEGSNQQQVRALIFPGDADLF